MIFFTADTHFNHSNIINLYGRSFSNVGQMNETLIKNWNSCINTNDEIYILGEGQARYRGRSVNSPVM